MGLIRFLHQEGHLKLHRIDPVADFEYLAGHASRIAKEIHLAAGDIRPIDGKFQYGKLKFTQQEAQLDIKSEPNSFLKGTDFLVNRTTQDF